MSLASLDLTDLYYTPGNFILLRAKGRTLTLDAIRGSPEVLLACLMPAERARIEGEPDKQSALVQLIGNIERDLAALYEKIAAQTRADSAIMEGGFVYRVNRSEAMGGPNYAVRRLSAKVPDLDSLGLNAAMCRQLKGLGRKHGLILMGGSTGAGKTTTASSMLTHFIKKHGEFAYTIEEPPEYPLEGDYTEGTSYGYCIQTTVTDKGDWAVKLRDALRSRPHYILVGEIRTPECASEVLRAANSGHLVFSTIHGQSIIDSMAALIKYAAPIMSEGLAQSQMAEGLLAAVHQSVNAGVFSANALFAGEKSSTVRNKILEGKFPMLSSDIEQQTIRLARGIAL